VSKKPIVLAVTSDHHCGSTVGLCPPEKIGLDDGGFYEPSPVQKWIWSCWESYWKKVVDQRRRLKAELYVVFNGDLFEGDHHQTTQIISSNPEPQSYVADRVFGKKSPVSAARPTRLFIVRGTETHVGPGGATEEAFAKIVGAEPDRVSTSRPIWSWWRLQLELNGVLIDFQHHGRMGQRPWTEGTAVNALAAQIFYEHARKGLRHPDIAVRSHFHRAFDSYTAHKVRVLQTPAWQLKTSYAHKVAPESLSDVGGVIVTIQPNGHTEVVMDIYSQYKVNPWKPQV
jgi:hypothetical protein